MQVAEEEFEQDGWASKSLAQVCDILREKHAIHLEVNELRANIWESQKSLFQIGLESDPSLIPFLEYCQQREIKLAIGSNSIRDRIEWVIKLMKIDSYFLYDKKNPGK
jgi:beta-phosphoglucomutase-like phosphatase (HAD superfamily)